MKVDKEIIGTFFHHGAIQLLTAALGENKDSWIEDELDREMGRKTGQKLCKTFPAMIAAYAGHTHIIEWFFEKHPCPPSLCDRVGLSPAYSNCIPLTSPQLIAI